MKWRRLLISAALWISASPLRADDFDKELAATMKLVVMIQGQLGAGPAFGAGIVVGREKNRLYILTANHVVRRGNVAATGIQVNLRSLPGKALPAQLLPRFDAGLDIAVLAVDNPASQGVDVCALELDQLGNPAGLKRGSDVYPVGNPNGVAWGMPVKPDQVSTVTGDQIAFQSSFIAVGMSGGALLDKNADLVALIRGDEPPLGLAVSLNKALPTVAHWGYPEQLWQDQDDFSTPLHRAAANGDVAKLKILLAQACIDVNQKAKYQRTPLHFAAEAGNAEAVQLLLRAGAKVDALSIPMGTPLDEAAAEGKADAARLLLTAGASVNATDSDRETPLLKAVVAGSLDVAKVLTEHGANANQGDDDAALPLGVAVWKGTPQMVALLISAGADVNSVAYNGAKNEVAPVLFLAAERGDPGILQQLLAAGAKVNTPSQYSGRALEVAVKGKRLEAVRVLLAAGADPHAPTSDKATVLHLAAAAGWTDGMKLLVGAGAPLNAFDSHGGTPLRNAINSGNRAAVEFLISAGAGFATMDPVRNSSSQKDTALCDAYRLHRSDNRAARIGVLQTLLAHAGPDLDAMAGPDGCRLFDDAAFEGDAATVSALLAAGAAPHGKGSEPLISAAGHGQAEIVKLMVAAKVDLNGADNRGYTALHRVFEEAPQYNLPIVRVLLDAGVKVNTVNDTGSTPLHAAIHNGWPVDIVKLLLAGGADPNLRDHENPSETPLSMAIWFNSAKGGASGVDVVQALLAAGAKPNGDKDYRPLVSSASDSQVEIVKTLVDAKADLNASYGNGYTALHRALSRKPDPRAIEVVRLLLAAGAKAATAETDGSTPLHDAVRNQWPLEIIRLLLSAGGDPNAKNHNDATPLSIATELNQTETVALLRSAMPENRKQ